LGPIPNPQSPIPNPQSPLTLKFYFIKNYYKKYDFNIIFIIYLIIKIFFSLNKK